MEFYGGAVICAGCLGTGSALGFPLSKLAMKPFFCGSFFACNARLSYSAFISCSAYFLASSALLSYSAFISYSACLLLSISLASYSFRSYSFLSSSRLRSISCYNRRCFSFSSFSFLNLAHSPLGTWFGQSLLAINLWHSSHFLVLDPHIITWSANYSNLKVWLQKLHSLGLRSQISSC